MSSGLGVHVGAQDGVNAGLVAALLAEPAEQVGVEAHGNGRAGCAVPNFTANSGAGTPFAPA